MNGAGAALPPRRSSADCARPAATQVAAYRPSADAVLGFESWMTPQEELPSEPLCRGCRPVRSRNRRSARGPAAARHARSRHSRGDGRRSARTSAGPWSGTTGWPAPAWPHRRSQRQPRCRGSSSGAARSAYVGSLVVGNLDRPIASADPSPEPPTWWFQFWLRQVRLHGASPEQAQHELTRRLGRSPANPTEAGYILGSAPAKGRSTAVPA